MKRMTDEDEKTGQKRLENEDEWEEEEESNCKVWY